MDRSSTKRIRHLLPLIALLPGLAACASFRGAPKPVMPAKELSKLANGERYGLAAIGTRIAAAQDKEAERNAFIAIQLAAIDARYFEYRRQLSAQSKGGNFGLELGVLALTGVGSVVGTPLANILSAGGAGLTGTKAALSKEVYFERTLPALLASIDARRIEARAPIIAGMKSPIADYPVGQAIADLFTYQGSASLDGAIERLTAAAASEKAAAVEKYANVIETCRPEKGVGREWLRLRTWMNGLPAATADATLTRVAAIVQAPPPSADAIETAADRKRRIAARLSQSYCRIAEVQALIDRISTEEGVTIP